MGNLGIAMILGMMSGDARRRENEERIRRGEPVRPDPVGNFVGGLAWLIVYIVGGLTVIVVAIVTISALWTHYRGVLFLVGGAALWILGSRLEKREKRKRMTQQS